MIGYVCMWFETIWGSRNAKKSRLQPHAFPQQQIPFLLPTQQPQLVAGTATKFTPVAAVSKRRHARRLSAPHTLALAPPGGGDLTAGTAYRPQCPAVVNCSSGPVIEAFVPGGPGTVIFADCVPVQRITETATVVATGLRNDSFYRVIVATDDTAGHLGGWSARVRTQDLTPPTFTVVDAPSPGFTSFGLVVTLNEAGTIFASLSLASEFLDGQPGPAAVPTCPPAPAVVSP